MMLKNKCIIVTGATSGIGRAIALCAAQNGAHVGINYRGDRNQALELCDHIEKAGFPSPELLQFDAAEPKEIERGIKDFFKKFKQLDGLVNNAATVHAGLLPVLAEQEIEDQIASTLIGPIFCCRAVLPYMLEGRKGSIVNIGSVVTAKAHPGQSVYAAAKGGIHAFSRALAVEYGKKNIRVNCVQPGPVDTKMFQTANHLAGGDIQKRIPLRRLCRPEEIAETVIFLLSDKSSGTTGGCIDIDGGYSIQ